jgi:hypothetical protein
LGKLPHGEQQMSKDLYLISVYYIHKSKAANFYNDALIYENNLERSLNSLFLWREQVDFQIETWKKMSENNRLEAIMISSGIAI